MNEIDQKSAAVQLLREFDTTADLSYKAFGTKLKVTTQPETILGIRMPIVRKMASRLSQLLPYDTAISLLKPLAERWYEYKLLLGLVVKEQRSQDEVTESIALLYSLCDGWAVPDLYQEVLGTFACNGFLPEVLQSIEQHQSDPNPFARRLTIVAHLPLLREGLICPDDVLRHIYQLETDSHYYVEMANAWVLAEIQLAYQELEGIETKLHSASLLKRYRQKLRESLRKR